MDKFRIASIQISNKKFYIIPVLNFLDTIVCQHNAMDPSNYHQLRFVFGEILKNRIDIAYPNTTGEITVDISMTDCYFEVSIKDKGIPGWHDFFYDAASVTKNKRDLRNFIMDMCVDEICLEKLGFDGQRICIRKKIINPVTFKKPEPYPEIEALDTNITIRRVTTEKDVIEAIRCIYFEYGYSYSYERLYYVDSFMKLIRTGEIMSFLAVNDHGQTAGHFALVFSDMYKDMPEISTVVIRKEFRGLGLFAKFMTFSEDLAREMGLRALMGQPVAFHPMSQKAFLRAGYSATSLLLSYLGSEIESEYNKIGERLSLSASVKLIDKTAKCKIFPPKRIADFVKKTFDRIGYGYDILDSDSDCFPTQMSVDTSTALCMTRITVSSAGNDFKDALKDAVKNSIKQKSEMIELVLSLNSESCEKAYDIAEECGFVFSGIIPGSSSGDYIIMQMFPGGEPDYSKLVMVGEFEELKNDVLNIIQNN